MRCNSLELTPARALRPRLLPVKGEQPLAIVGFVGSHRLEHPAKGEVGIEPFSSSRKMDNARISHSVGGCRKISCGEMISVVFWGSCDTKGRPSEMST